MIAADPTQVPSAAEAIDTSVEPLIVLSEPAALEVQSLQKTNPDNAGKTLRLFVEKGGCSGMQYGMVFDENRPNDVITQQHGVTVLVDSFSATYLKGCHVDFHDTLNAGGFKISNPNAKQSCGCGKSFEA